MPFTHALFEPTEPPDAIRGQRPQHVYAFEPDSELVVAINVALATGRPLLVRGSPGSGKSTIARAIADHFEARLLTFVVSGRSSARDLLWSYDAVRRLADAQLEKILPTEAYIQPGVLWWAFAPTRAATRNLDADAWANLKDSAHGEPEMVEAVAPDLHFAEPRGRPAGSREPRSVVLIDEIDKADPDFPNSLLDALGRHRFRVDELDREIRCEATPPFIVVTTNEERSLPGPFVRRCVSTTLPEPSAARLVLIARKHFGPEKVEGLYLELANQTTRIRERRQPHGQRFPSVAEYLDAVEACSRLEAPLELDNEGRPHGTYAQLLAVTLDKRDGGQDDGQGADWI